MEVTRGFPDTQEFGPGGRELHEHGLHQILRIRPASRQRQPVPEERGRMTVVQLRQRLRSASRETGQKLAIAPIVAFTQHS
jgi:hypothetical protein